MNADQLAQYFDHTQLRAYATDADFETLCAESRKYHFRMVAINPAPVRLCKRLLAGTDIRIGRVLHPSPASPAANRGWAEAATRQLAALGVWP